METAREIKRRVISFVFSARIPFAFSPFRTSLLLSSINRATEQASNGPVPRKGDDDDDDDAYCVI
jgi:hypothetical protein